ncbi:phosphatidylinositol-4-phosphate 5-kinase, putative (PIP5K) [Plasmodium ovale curtisi]|uniref:Phosphatidylinositol-4-phosphate 5-kinase, putative (PIP5K) n=1 Tax=Plasmodium ovale curtisi TaxID=864141 RepID=A0A1A8VMN2_PLAOA|nr:phosphatidylinositol-4-phosphate 5-kinase, putative (PIP5K) [Plasmodium ovale curtisi]
MKCNSVNVRSVLDYTLKKKIRESTYLSDEEIMIIYKRFNSISNEGRLNYEKFEKSLGILGTIKNAYLYRSIFKAFDLNNDDYLDIYEFCVAISTMLKGNERDKLRLSYRIVHSGVGVPGPVCSAIGDGGIGAVDVTGESRDFSSYITYEDFEKIVLSINDIKKKLLGTEEEIVTTQVKYTFKSLSLLCEDGKYRMNLECYKKAMKCTEFLKLLGIHTKVADVFLQKEVLKKRKSKTGKSKKGKGDIGKTSTHLMKSFSESKSARRSILKGSTNLFLRRNRKKKKKGSDKKGKESQVGDGKESHMGDVTTIQPNGKYYSPSSAHAVSLNLETGINKNIVTKKGQRGPTRSARRRKSRSSSKCGSGSDGLSDIHSNSRGGYRSRALFECSYRDNSNELKGKEENAKEGKNTTNKKIYFFKVDDEECFTTDSNVQNTCSPSCRGGTPGEVKGEKGARGILQIKMKENRTREMGGNASDSSRHFLEYHSDIEVMNFRKQLHEERKKKENPKRSKDTTHREGKREDKRLYQDEVEAGEETNRGRSTIQDMHISIGEEEVEKNTHIESIPVGRVNKKEGNHISIFMDRKYRCKENSPSCDDACSFWKEENIYVGKKKDFIGDKNCFVNASKGITAQFDMKSAIMNFEKKKENKTYVEEYNELMAQYKKYVQEEGIEHEEDISPEVEDRRQAETRTGENDMWGGVGERVGEGVGEGGDTIDSADGGFGDSGYRSPESSECNSENNEGIGNFYLFSRSGAEQGENDTTVEGSTRYLYRKFQQYSRFANNFEDRRENPIEGKGVTLKRCQPVPACLDFSDDVLNKKFYIPMVKSHYVMVNRNLTREKVFYIIRNLLLSIDELLKRDKAGDPHGVFFLFFSAFSYSWDQGVTGDVEKEGNEVIKRDDENFEHGNNRMCIFQNVLLIISIVRYFLHTITISQKCSSSYDSIEGNLTMHNNISSHTVNEVSILLNAANEILSKYSKGCFQNKKIYINKSNCYNVSKKRKLKGKLKGKLSVSIRQNREKRNFQKILAVYFGHERWDLVMNMMIGIRISAIKEFNENVILNYFKHKDVLQLPTSNAQQKVIFKNYAPIIFKKIRSFYGIKAKEYITSVGPEQVISNMVLGNLSTLSELLSEGKSGSLFYFTSNGKYIIKTVCKSIHNLSKKLLPKYYEHIRKNPDTLLTRLYGIHCIKYRSVSTIGGRGKGKIYFIVMNNFFSSAVEIHRRYDIKGSLVGRTVPLAKREDHTIALKDVDIDELGDTINVGPQNKEKLLKILKLDADFLKENLLLDYSLLFGIHYKELSRDLVNWSRTKTGEVRHVFDDHGICLAARPFHQCDHGGMINVDKNKVFFFGIIDIFTKWNLKKKFEHTFRTIQKLDGKNISCIHPKAYASNPSIKC